MGNLEALARRGSDTERIREFPGKEGTYVLFPDQPVAPDSPDTFQLLLERAVEQHNDDDKSRRYGDNPVKITTVVGEDGGNKRKQVWQGFEPIRWNPEKGQQVVCITGSPETVKAVLGNAKSEAAKRQGPGKPPFRRLLPA